MRTVTEKSLRAFFNHKNGKFGGVCTNQYAGSAYGKVNTEVKDDTLYLFGNAIAKLVNDDLYVRVVACTNTTRERLNGLGEFGYKISVTQRNYNAFINGKEVMDYMQWQKIEKI